MKLMCQHCGHEFEGLFDKFPDYWPDCIWCPECAKLTPVKIAERLYRKEHHGAADCSVVA